MSQTQPYLTSPNILAPKPAKKRAGHASDAGPRLALSKQQASLAKPGAILEKHVPSPQPSSIIDHEQPCRVLKRERDQRASSVLKKCLETNGNELKRLETNEQTGERGREVQQRLPAQVEHNPSSNLRRVSPQPPSQYRTSLDAGYTADGTQSQRNSCCDVKS